MTKTRALAASLLILVALSGCSREPATTLPSNAPETAQPSATATPSPTAAAAGRPPLHELTLTTEGLGYLEIGAPIVDSPPEEAIVVFDDDVCAEVAASPEDAGRWVSAYPGGDGGSFYLSVQNDELYRIFVTSPSIVTERGIGIGVDESAMKQAYPEATIGDRDDEFVTLYVVYGDRGNLTFEISRDPESEHFGAVKFMTAMTSDVEPWAISNTGAGATCGD